MLDEEAESEDSEVIDIAAVGQSIRVRKFGSLAAKRIEACLWPRHRPGLV
jgi:hypothetical protein